MIKGISKQQSNDIIIKKTRKQRFDERKKHTGTVSVHLTKDHHHGNEENAKGSLHQAN
jgi:hypothetical protein